MRSVTVTRVVTRVYTETCTERVTVTVTRVVSEVVVGEKGFNVSSFVVPLTISRVVPYASYRVLVVSGCWSPKFFANVSALYSLLGFSDVFATILRGYLVVFGRGFVSVVGIYDVRSLKPLELFACSVDIEPRGIVEPADEVFVNESFVACAIDMHRIPNLRMAQR